jgi:hypothetical protein
MANFLEFFKNIKNLWNEWSFEICVIILILFLFFGFIYHKITGTKGTWSNKYYYNDNHTIIKETKNIYDVSWTDENGFLSVKLPSVFNITADIFLPSIRFHSKFFEISENWPFYFSVFVNFHL